MLDFLGITQQEVFGMLAQLTLGLINGSFYALLSLGLAIIFGQLNIINFAHGAQYMLGAFGAYFLLQAGIGYWPALLVSPLIVGVFGALLERNMISQLKVRSKTRSVVLFGSFFALFVLLAASHLFTSAPDLPSLMGYNLDATAAFGIAALGALIVTTIWANVQVLSETGTQASDPLYGLLLTFGLALIIQGLFSNEYGVSGLPYTIPDELKGAQPLGYMFLPKYRGWVLIASVIVCIGTWLMIEKTKLGAYLRAATENPGLLQAFGVNVPRLITFTYALGVGLAGLAGVLAAPINSVRPDMGANYIIIVFAVVVIGGMGSIMGSIVTGFLLGLVEGMTKVFYPQGASTVIFVVMAIVLLWKPAGLFGRNA